MICMSINALDSTPLGSVHGAYRCGEIFCSHTECVDKLTSVRFGITSGGNKIIARCLRMDMHVEFVERQCGSRR